MGNAKCRTLYLGILHFVLTHWNTQEPVYDPQQFILHFCWKSGTGSDFSPSTSSIPCQLPLHKSRTFIRLSAGPGTKDPLAEALRKDCVSSYLKNKKDHFEKRNYANVLKNEVSTAE